jgi:hypothetical protein
MALFCAPCARAVGLAGSDLAGWLAGGGLEWGLCEGCGWHLLDAAGNPACAPHEPAAVGEACGACLALSGLGHGVTAGGRGGCGR